MVVFGRRAPIAQSIRSPYLSLVDAMSSEKTIQSFVCAKDCYFSLEFSVGSS